MSGFALPDDFASQSICACRAEETIAQERGVACLIEAGRYPAAGLVQIGGLRPLRHYRLRGAAAGFCRSDADGIGTITVSVTRPSLLVLEAVVA